MTVAPVNPAPISLRPENLHGLVGRFASGEALVRATRQAYEAGYRRMDAYSPVPVEGLAEAMGRRGSVMPLIVLGGGIAGGFTGWFMQWFSATYDYPFNFATGVSFLYGLAIASVLAVLMVLAASLTVLFAAVGGTLGMLFLDGLPRLHHPIFHAVGIERATVDRFFLCLEATDPRWERDATRRFLEDELHAADVVEVKR